jgi:PKD repeat protein
MRIGRLGLIDGMPDVPAAPTNATIDDIIIAGNDASASLRIFWDASIDSVYSYNVYRENPDLTRTFLGGTPNTALFIPYLGRVDAETTAVLEIEAISPEFGRSLPGTVSVFWGYDPPNEWPVANAGGPYCGPPFTPLAFRSDGTSDPDGTIVEYLWHFGDGDSSGAAHPTHAYAAVGEYEVVLTVTDDLGKWASDTTSASITTVPSDLTPNTAWFPLNEGGGAVAGDSSGNGNDGAIFGATWVGGSGGGALDFDGIDDYVIVSSLPVPSSTVTVAAWAWAETHAAWGSLVKNWAAQTGAFHLGLSESDGDLQAYLGEADEGVISLREGAATPLPLNEWQHVALVADRSEVRLYRNGLQVDRTPYDGTLKTTRPGLGIGVKLNNYGTTPSNSLPSYWDGIIDDVRIYDWPLCQNEIQQLHEMYATVLPKPAAGAAATDFALGQNLPNPFSPTTNVRYAVAYETHVSITVYDVRGRKVADLVNERQGPGSYYVRWRGRDSRGRMVASGMYFYRMVADEFTSVRKMLLIR